MAFDPRKTSVAALAYFGDSVVEIFARHYLLQKGVTRSEDLNREALQFVTAKSQSKAMEIILPLLSEEETLMFKAGKNPGHLRAPSGVSLETYRVATGMEALFARLFLDGRIERLAELFAKGYGADISLVRVLDETDSIIKKEAD